LRAILVKSLNIVGLPAKMQLQTKKYELQTGIGNRDILKMSLPISVSILVPQFNFITNNIFLGHYSTEAFAIASITGVYYLIFSMIGFGLNSGLQILIARRAGENKPREIGKLFGQGIYISLTVAFIGIFFTWFISPYILRSVLHAEHISDAAIEYLRIRIWGLPLLYMYQMRNAVLIGTNNSRYLIIGTLAETITNVGFDYLFIFGHWGFPEMGLNGAAVASIIAEFMGMAVIYYVIYYKKISHRFSLFQSFAPDKNQIKKILGVSLPLVFQFAISIISWEFFFILVEHHGENALAVSNIMRNVFGISGCITWAFAAASSTMISNLIGQERKEEVRLLIRRIVKICSGLTLILIILINLFPQQLISLFGQDKNFISESVAVVRVVTIAIFIMSMAVVWLNAVTGTGNSKISFYIELITISVYSVYVYIILETLNLPITIGWTAEWVYWLFILGLSFLYIRRGNWKNKRI